MFLRPKNLTRNLIPSRPPIFTQNSNPCTNIESEGEARAMNDDGDTIVASVDEG